MLSHGLFHVNSNFCVHVQMGAAYEMPDGQRNLRKHRREEADHDISDLGCSPQKQLHK